MPVTLHLGDCKTVLADMPAASVDAIVTDPPYELGFMGKGWDSSGIAYDADLWAECLRVLKPGGHLLAFGGTRTYHRMTVAIEDAGFEIRDSIHWLYGSGFPKSLDVSKAIDKAGGNPLAFRVFARAYAAAVEGSPLAHADIDRHLGIKSSSCYWAREDHRGGMPPRHHWERVRDLLGLDESFARLYDEAEREVIGERTTGRGTGKGGTAFIGDSDNRDITAPATPAAAQWQGWGTALKPAHEILVAARKPDDIEVVTKELDRLWQVLEAAPRTRTGGEDGSSDPTATSPSGSEATTSWNIVSSWRECWAETCDLMSTSTIATRSSTTTDLRTLLSCLSQITPANITTDPTRPSGLTSTASAADQLFAAVLLSLRATRELSAAESATGATPTSPPDAPDRRHRPIVVARKPLAGTVAANVLAHGTGAINVDGCRVATDEDRSRPPGRTPEAATFSASTNGSTMHLRERPSESHAAGRWPSNIVLTHAPDCADTCAEGCPVAEMDRQSGALKSGKMKAGTERGNRDGWAGPMPASTGAETYGDSGGASRFFPVFRYQAKAPASERPVGPDGTKHATVKPLALMRWLVRLVTPPGGTVLDPFAGSGTTLEAALLEGFDCIGVERDPAHVELCKIRIERVGGQYAVPTDWNGSAA